MGPLRRNRVFRGKGSAELRALCDGSRLTKLAAAFLNVTIDENGNLVNFNSFGTAIRRVRRSWMLMVTKSFQRVTFGTTSQLTTSSRHHSVQRLCLMVSSLFGDETDVFYDIYAVPCF